MSAYSTTRYEVVRVVNAHDLTVEEGHDALADAIRDADRLAEWNPGRTYEVLDTKRNEVVSTHEWPAS